MARRCPAAVWQTRVSGLALAVALVHAPVVAQTAAILRGSAGLTSPVVGAPAATVPAVPSTAPNAAGMRSASARAIANQAGAAGAQDLARQANDAARAAARLTTQTIPNGLVTGGLVPVANTTTAALDPTGLRTWEGATKPVQTGTSAAPVVTIDQTAQRALLSWESFNVGRDTSLVFNQQPGWVVLNRIVTNIDPVTGRLSDPAALAPSTILGTIKSQGTVLVLNQNGVLFGPTAQVNVRSLIASSLEIGAPSRETRITGGTLIITVPTSLTDRGISFLQSGLLTQSALLSAVLLPNQFGTNVIEPTTTEGAVRVAAGATLESAAGGYVIIAAPRIENAGVLRSAEGQVSLQSGRRIDAVASSGSADSADPEVRGLLLSSIGQTPDGVINTATGLIEAPRGYVSIAGTVTGTVSTAGVIAATTSVTRNGKIVLSGAKVTLEPGAAITITPDSNGEKLPQGASSVAAFKHSVIEIGGAETRGVVSPAEISIGAGARIYAPSASVSIGATNDAATTSVFDDSLAPASSVFVDNGAVIDVGGIKDYVVPASRNSIEITPVKRNELRDTPNYREATTDGSFTLNGSTLLVDPRLSGVRADGVAWVGSPLIEAGSYFAQVGVTAAELMTSGGDLTLGVRSFGQGSEAVAAAVTVKSGAVLDVSGGWVRYEEGAVQTSRLRTADGRIVEIGRADPNDNFVAVLAPISAEQPRFGLTQSFGNAAAQRNGFEPGYTEGRDAGSLTIKASTNSLQGTIHADAFAGTRQVATGNAADRPSVIDRDLRLMQSAPSQLPTGGLLKIAAIGTGTSDQAGGADIIVYSGTGAVPTRQFSEILLADSYLSGSGLSAVTLQTSGRIDVRAGSAVTLAADGAFVADAGRSIRFDGSVNIASGTIAARTYEVVPGSVFRDDDDLPSVLAEGTPTPRLFDISVNGRLSARGRWSNDFLVTDGAYLGGAYVDGGSVSLQVAPRVLIAIGETPDFSADLSGSIFVNAGSRIDVSAGGHVRPNGSLDLTGRGGDVALVNETSYSQLIIQSFVLPGVAARNPGIETPGFVTTADPQRQSGLAPRVAEAQVFLAPDTISAQGFVGGGSFSLVTPDLNFGARAGASGTALPLDFVSRTGFAEISVTTYATRLLGPTRVGGVELNSVFANNVNGTVALLDTETVVINAGERVDLTQSLIESLPTDAAANAARNLATGGDIAGLLGVGVPLAEWDRRPVALSFGGLTEVEIRSGGVLTGSSGASLTTPKLFNAGTIRIAGGSILQRSILPSALSSEQRRAIGVSGLAGVDGLAGIFGARDADGRFAETAPNALGIAANSVPGAPILDNADLASRGNVSRAIYFTAELAADEGIRLAPGSVTDLSGASVRNPRAGARPGGDQKITGLVVAGGTLEAAGRQVGVGPVLSPLPLFGIARLSDPVSGSPVPLQQPGMTLTAAAGARIDLSGAADLYDFETALGVFTLSAVWSRGGRLTLGAGGSLTDSIIRADGGATAAEGGVLTWLDPVLRQADVAGQAQDVVAANQIAAAGFDSFVALDRLTTLGDATLTLGRAFYLTSRPYEGDASALGSYTATLATTGRLDITAAYVQLASPQQGVLPTAAANPDDTGTVTLRARTIDIIGSVYADASVSTLTLQASGDVRLTGVQPTILSLVGTSNLPVASSLTGQLVTNGDLTINATQVYPTTGTGSLQQDINAQRAGTPPTAVPYLIASTGETATIRFGRVGSLPATPYSAGGNLLVQAASIVQDGVVRVPIGRLVLGANTPLTIGSSLVPAIVPATTSLRLGAGSTTSVAAGGLAIPYGTTTDGIEYFFTPTSDGRLFAPPAAELNLSGDSVAVDDGASVDARGGGSLYGYEFAAGVGGSRDVLDRFNSDSFSGTDGFQYPDGRRVYAIVPGLADADVAPYDPLYSADYGDLYGATDAGRRVFLEAAPGLAEGWYTLLPARYALLPGGFRVVENVGEAVPASGETAQLRDGSLIVGGRYGIAGTGIEESQRRTFTVQDQATFRKFSNIQLTDAATSLAALARRDKLAVPQLPADAARLVLAPLSELSINTRFLTDPATGGRGSKIDIAGNAFEIIVPGAGSTPGSIVLTTRDFSNLNAASLLIGGIRSDRADGSTAISVTASSIEVANDAANPLNAPEVLLVVDGIGSRIDIADGAVVTATGDLGDDRSGAYLITASTDTGQTGAGGLIRVANGPARLLQRPGALALANSLEDATISIGEARLAGAAIVLDSSRDLVITDNLATAATPLITATTSLVLGGDDVFFTTAPSGYRGLVITPQLEAQFAAAETLSITSPSIIGFSPGVHAFRNLKLDARGIRPYGQTVTPPAEPRQDQVDVPAADLTAPIAVTLRADSFGLANSDIPRTPCEGVGVPAACGTTGNTLIVDAREIHLGSGSMAIFGFDRSVTLNAREGVFVEGVGSLDVGGAALTVNTPYLGDRALVADPRRQEAPSLDILAGQVRLAGTAGTLAPGGGAPGTTLRFGTVERPVTSFEATGLLVRASAGVLDVRSTGSVIATGGARLEVPGYSRSFGDAADRVIVSAPGGILNLVSLRGDVDLAGASVSIGGGTGSAGTLQLSAALGRVMLADTIDAAAPDGRAGLTINSGTAAFDLAAFLARPGAAFTGDIRIRTGVGNLAIAADQSLVAESLYLSADGGQVLIAGRIDTSGVNGGDIGLYGTAGVTLAGTARLDAHADGYAADDTRAARGGNVIIGTAGDSAITVSSGAIIEVGARRPGARVIQQIRKDALTLNDTITYNYAQSDVGGTVTFRAPVLLEGDGAQAVAIRYDGIIAGARDISVEGYRVYDLSTLALANCTGADICINSRGQAVLDVNAAPGRANILSGIAPGTIANFVRNFDLSASSGLGTLTGNPVFHARPGVQLEHDGDIILASNWNLGAASVNVAAAVADGLMAASPQLGTGYTYVIPGREAELYSGYSQSAGDYYTDFTYRVGGRATGEAGVLTLRAGGQLDIRGSISDGFFAFGDATDPAYLNFQLAGGDRQYRPALELTCGAPALSCLELFTPFFVAPGATTPPFGLADVANIGVRSLSRGQDIVDIAGPALAPYSAVANAPGALGSQPDDAGDAIGSAVLAPRLADGRAASSFSLRLVGGAVAPGGSRAVTADPASVAPSSTAGASVSGETTYRAVGAAETQQYQGDLQLTNYDPAQGVDIAANPGNFIDALAAQGITFDPTTYTRLTLSGASPEIRNFFVTAVRKYLADNAVPDDQYQFFGPANNPTIFASGAGLMTQILETVSPDFSALIGQGGINYAPPRSPPVTSLQNPNITTRSLVRTGIGSIDVAAAGDVDLTNGRQVFRAANGRVTGSAAVSGAQVGGTAIYTAGHRVDPGAMTAVDAATGKLLAVDPSLTAARVATGNFQPNLQGVFDAEPVYADGGGNVRISAGRDVVARRDAWAESFRRPTINGGPVFANVGTDTQLWRPISRPDQTQVFLPATNIRINPQLFSSGVGALGGGAVIVTAGRDIRELTAVSDTSITTALVSDTTRPAAAAALTLVSYGGGNVDLTAGRDIRGGAVDATSGAATIAAGGSISSAGRLRLAGTAASPIASPEENLLRIRVADGAAAVTAIGAVDIGGIASTDGEGFYAQTAGLSIKANGDVRLANTGKDITVAFSRSNDTRPDRPGALLPGSLEVAALAGDISLSDATLRPATLREQLSLVLVPSPSGQLRLFAGGDLASVTLAMDDGDPSLTPGPLSALTQALLADLNNNNPATRRFGFPVILPNTSDADRRRLHNERTTHAGDAEPVRIFAGGDIDAVTLSVPKQARIGAGGNITDMIFIGQNIGAGDVTRITAGGDIIATSRVLAVPTATGSANLPVLQGNNFVIGGPGAFFIEAGRDLGPFFNSAVVGPSQIYGGGVLTVGNDYNPWLGSAGAKIYAQFGVAKGADYDTLRQVYVNPANVAGLDGDLFVQAIDANGNRVPDRAKPIYATALVGWLVENQPDAITAAFGAPITLTSANVVPLLDSLDTATRTQFLADLPYLPVGGGIDSAQVAIDRTVVAAPVLITGSAVTTTPEAQRTTISGSTLVGWLAQNAPQVLVDRYGLTSTDVGRAYAELAALPSLLQRQFLLDRVYFNELTAPSRPDGASSQQFIRGYRAVDRLFPAALGYTANDLGGTVNGGTKVPTGNLDLRLATLETQRGGDVTIIGPGGRVLGGSVVATSAQAARRGAEVQGVNNLFTGQRRPPQDISSAARILDIPIGFEGVLTLRGGSVRGFTDGDFLLNQSRLFTLSGGDITLWSSNGDLNAGQGVKTSASNPPVVVRFDPNGLGTLDQAGAVSGAGIAALRPLGSARAADITLVAPVGTVDAGDAGVRASGNVFVAAARVANADNFKVGGTAFGNIAATTVDTGAAASANAASAAASQAASAVNPTNKGGEAGSRISVEVLGFAGDAADDPCNKAVGERPTNCSPPRN